MNHWTKNDKEINHLTEVCSDLDLGIVLKPLTGYVSSSEDLRDEDLCESHYVFAWFQVR